MAIRGVSLLDMDFSKEFPFEFTVQSYGCTKLNVMYTNDTDSVSSASPQSYGRTRFWSIRPFHWQRRLHLRYGGEKEERDDSAIWCNQLVDIQKQYKIISNEQEKDSVVDLAETIIDP